MLVKTSKNLEKYKEQNEFMSEKCAYLYPHSTSEILENTNTCITTYHVASGKVYSVLKRMRTATLPIYNQGMQPLREG